MPIAKIVVGIDFSESSNRALKEALTIARRDGAELCLVHVCGVPELAEKAFRTPALVEYEKILRARFADSRKALDAVRHSVEGQGAQVSQNLIEGYPAESLAKAAAELNADLVVVGSVGRTGVSRLLIGSVAEKVVRLTDANVLVSRGAGDASRGYSRILVPVDFSTYTERAVEVALKMVAEKGAIELFYATGLPFAMGGADGAWMAAWDHLQLDMGSTSEQRGAELVAKYAPKTSATLVFRHAFANPNSAIRERLEGNEVSLVVMGSHGHRGWQRWTLGSTAEVTVRHAPCSVLVVHDKSSRRL